MKLTSCFLVMFMLTVLVLIGSTGQGTAVESATSAEQLALVRGDIASLETVLASHPWACRRSLGGGTAGWESSEFAAYTAGILESEGYLVRLVLRTRAEGPDHTWVLVGLPLRAPTLWVPVEASPRTGVIQSVLGHVAWSEGTGGSHATLDATYLTWDRALSLPDNAPPVARLRAPASGEEAGDLVRLSGLLSYDPDGEIVLYQWRFGPEEPVITAESGIEQRFAESGSYMVELTVVDARGAASAVTGRVVVVDRSSAENAPAPTSGCGCGG